MTFGEAVRRRRKALGLTLEQLAERAKLSPNYVGTVENGRRDPSLSTVEQIAKALGAPAAELLGGVRDLGPMGVEAGRLVEGLSREVQEPLLGVASLSAPSSPVTASAGRASGFGSAVVDQAQDVSCLTNVDLHADEQLAAFGDCALEQELRVLRALPVGDVDKDGAVRCDGEARSMDARLHLDEYAKKACAFGGGQHPGGIPNVTSNLRRHAAGSSR